MRKTLTINTNVELVAIMTRNVGNSQCEVDYFALVGEGPQRRCVSPQRLTTEQKKMSVQDYIDFGRCEFFKLVRPHHMLKLRAMFPNN